MASNKMHAWIMAARPRTLPAAVSPVLVGSALAFYEGAFKPGPALAALLGSLFIQIGANFANDYMDFLKGSDTKDRLGPTRVTAAGLLSVREVQAGTALVFGLAVLCGLYLTYAAGWPVVVIGVLSILAALAYTGGPYPLGYNGLGEIFVFIFFGLAAVGGTYYVQALHYNEAAFAASIPIGCLVVAILVVNNLRDIEDDRKAGKRTMAVRYGITWTRREYALLLALAFFSPVLMALSGLLPAWIMLVWLAMPLGYRLIHAVASDSGRSLNRSLAGTGSLELVFSLLFSLGLVMGKIL
jgi:1,4-dihydroxy-2-naphthoate polyprenyltransferase